MWFGFRDSFGIGDASSCGCIPRDVVFTMMLIVGRYFSNVDWSKLITVALRFSCSFRSNAFCLVLLARKIRASEFFSEVRIALDAPPAPMTRMFLLAKEMPSSFSDSKNPIPSVLYPVFVSSNLTVFTAWISFADWSSASISFITSTLCGIVTLIPARSVCFMNCSRFSGATSKAS